MNLALSLKGDCRMLIYRPTVNTIMASSFEKKKNTFSLNFFFISLWDESCLPLLMRIYSHKAGLYIKESIPKNVKHHIMILYLLLQFLQLTKVLAIT